MSSILIASMIFNILYYFIPETDYCYIGLLLFVNI